MRLNVHSSTVFAGGRPLSTQFLPGQGRPLSTILGIRKLKTLSYPTDLRSLVLTHYQSATDRQTDGQKDEWICRSIYMYSTCKACFASRCKK